MDGLGTLAAIANPPSMTFVRWDKGPGEQPLPKKFNEYREKINLCFKKIALVNLSPVLSQKLYSGFSSNLGSGEYRMSTLMP